MDGIDLVTIWLTMYGTCPNGWIAVCDAAFCSPLAKLTEVNSYGTSFSLQMRATRRVHVEPEKPYNLTIV